MLARVQNVRNSTHSYSSLTSPTPYEAKACMEDTRSGMPGQKNRSAREGYSDGGEAGKKRERERGIDREGVRVGERDRAGG